MGNVTDAIVGMAEALAVVRDLPLISVSFETVPAPDLVKVLLDETTYAQVQAWNPEGVETTELFTDEGETSTFRYLTVGRVQVLAIFDEATPDDEPDDEDVTGYYKDRS